LQSKIIAIENSACFQLGTQSKIYYLCVDLDSIFKLASLSTSCAWNMGSQDGEKNFSANWKIWWQDEWTKRRLQL